VDKDDDDKLIDKVIDIGADFAEASAAFKRAIKALPDPKVHVELAVCSERIQRGERYEEEIAADQLEHFRRLAKRLDAQFVVVPTFGDMYRIAMWWDDSGRLRSFRPTTH
jgi:hypothetical protein